ncbi:MAG TPA: hypothetical protein VM889_03160 [Candidatus Thermoplasmatota archaeon]|nr:hypothetical protein [Candidatus Thermoplasmatota archaeon]
MDVLGRGRRGASSLVRALAPTSKEAWVRLRLLGWSLIGLWQVLGLLSEFMPLDLEAKAVRIAGRVLGLLGLFFVAYGFERIVHKAERAAAHREKV